MSEVKSVLKLEVVDENSRRLEGGKLLANAPEGEEVVISGLAGRFPNSDDVYEFRDNLYNKVDLCDDDTRRWEHTHPGIPKRSGKVHHVDKFDAEFFGIHQREVDSMDPLSRILMERMFEAIVDAGLHPEDLAGTRTGVFVGSCYSETEHHICFDDMKPGGMGAVSCNRAMQAHRISYWLKLQGPSYVLDTACSSTCFALEHAFRAIRTGLCDSALVGGANLCMHPFVTLKFANLGVLSPEGICKPFDDNADGYTRSEAMVAVLLQKSKDAKRIYARILHSKLNVDGYKEQGITYPSGEAQKELLENVFEECGVPLDKVTFMEAHGTGTKVGDPEELRAIDEVFLGHRTRPLLIGSVKSSIGHTEPVSGLCSLAKVIIGMENGFIPPNINFRTPRKDVQGFTQGRLKVVDEKTPWPDRDVIVGVNCFGFGGANSHTLLQWNNKQKSKLGLPQDDLPRLVCVSGRTKEAVEAVLDDLKGRGLDAEYVGLLHNIFRKNINCHHYRGYSMLSKQGEISRSIKEFSDITKDLYFVCSENIANSNDILLKLKHFYSFTSLRTKAISVYTSNNLQTIIKTDFVNTLIVQMGLFNVFKTIGVAFKLVSLGILGYLLELFAENTLSLDCILLVAAMIEENKNKSQAGLGQKLYDKISMYVQYNEAEYTVKRLLTVPDSRKVLQEIHYNSIVTSFDAVILADLDCRISTANLFGTKDDNNNFVFDLLSSLGSLYELGVDISLDKLYPAISWPVSRGTPMISPIIKWKHNKSWFLIKYGMKKCCAVKKIDVLMNNADNHFLKGHIIDGRNLYPATGYLLLVWDLLSIIRQKIYITMQIVFENVRFNRATNILDDTLEFIVSINKSNGEFEVAEGGFPIVTGRVYEVSNIDDEFTVLPVPDSSHAKPCFEKDVYKELRLRGYNYKGLFRGIQEFRGFEALVQWRNNWVAFMDNLLQLKILQEDTRMLYVPTGIQRLVIDAKNHVEYTMNLDENAALPVHIYKDLGIIRSKFVEIRGLKASAIAKKKPLGEPVLEKYVFVPNLGEVLPFSDAIRINTQIILESSGLQKIKVSEIVLDCQNKCEDILKYIQGVFDDEPMVQVEIGEILNIENEMDTLSNNKLVVGMSLLKNKMMDILIESISINSFVISRESISFNLQMVPKQLKLLTAFNTSEELIVMCTKVDSKVEYNCLNVTDRDHSFQWLPKLQDHLKIDQELIIFAQNDDLNGIIGLTNCIRREPGQEHVRCCFVCDKKAPKFDPDNPFFKNQLDKGLYMNVFKNGSWGTYRHLLLGDSNFVRKDHCYANTLVRGDLSSMRWIEGPLSMDHDEEIDKSLIYTYYSALNFRDVMTASGRINADSFIKNRLEQECVQGIEFSGRTKRGQRVMGMLNYGGLATIVSADKRLLFRVPDAWSLEEAATVPVVYGTVLYAFFMRANLRSGHSVLIHSGTGGVGQAAINVALHLGCTVFTTVGTEEKRAFIRHHYPQLRPSHIGCSRDTSFEQMVMQQTKGRGVDLVLNSLAEEKLQASIRCLARGGDFLEIGKFDLANDNPLKMELCAKECTFHGIMLDSIFNASSTVKIDVVNKILRFIACGAVKPLLRTIFKQTEVEEAFRYMATGKHIGKVLIRIRREEPECVIIPKPEQINCIPRFYGQLDRSYVILGGLGGFGLELADWLVLRGARNLVLTSRTGIKTGYQQQRINLWKSYGVRVLVLTDDILTKEGCTDVINKATELGPIDTLFNLAVVLKDSLLANQTIENFKTSFGPKPCTTMFMDEITREICPKLRDFVVFSSVSCGRGNAGQSNYGLANSIMERVCERRVADGLPGLAIQWGAIGDVGLVADLQEEMVDIVIGGTLQQRVSSCLEVLDRFLRSNQGRPQPVLASMVVAEKRASAGASDNMVDAVVNIMGIRDLKTISLHSTLPELGMDSMMAVEIKQMLEREYEVFLTAQDMRNMTLARLQEISERGTSESVENIVAANTEKGVQFMLQLIGNEDTARKPVVLLRTLHTPSKPCKSVYFLPGIEGIASVFDALTSKLNMSVKCLQYCPQNYFTRVSDIAEDLLQHMNDADKSTKFNLVAYSYGGTIAMEMVAKLEQRGYLGNVVLIDASPDFTKKIIEQQLQFESDDILQTSVLCAIMSNYLHEEKIESLKVDIFKCSTIEQRIKIVLDNSPTTQHSSSFLTDVCKSSYLRVKALIDYKPSYTKIKSNVKLLRPISSSVGEIANDYGLSSICHNPVTVICYEGDHYSILENKKVAIEVDNTFRVGLDKLSVFNKLIKNDNVNNVKARYEFIK